MDRLTVQTLMYLKLSVAGHLTIFLTRTRGPFWSIRPAKILWIAVLSTQTIATLIAVYGLFMTPLGWKWAGFVWGYAIAWALVNDRIKLLAYRIFDPQKAQAAAKQPTASASTQASPNAAPVDDTEAIAARAFELYQQRAHGGSPQEQDWLEAERETHLEEAAKKKPAA
jgi:H+-transporting ATPase